MMHYDALAQAAPAPPMAKYIPPSKRPGYVPPAGPNSSLRPQNRPPIRGRDGTPRYTAAELTQHFTHPQDSTLSYFAYTSIERSSPRPPYNPSRTPQDTPLPSSPPPPPPSHPLSHLISYVCIFNNAHPAWRSDRELWVHTNADKLIADWGGDRKNFGRPMPVFEQMQGSRSHFTFSGWHIMEDVKVVAPKSDELLQLLQAKEKGRSYGSGRTKEAWQDAMSQIWVKVRFSRPTAVLRGGKRLRNIMDMRGGVDGEIESYLLEVGGLMDEQKIMGDHADETKRVMERLGPA